MAEDSEIAGMAKVTVMSEYSVNVEVVRVSIIFGDSVISKDA